MTNKLTLRPTGGTFRTAMLIADYVNNTTNPPTPDCVPTLTKVNGLPVAAALELQSTYGALILPRMNTAARNALGIANVSATVDGMVIFNTDTASVESLQGGVWSTISLGAIASPVVNLNQAANQGLNAAAVQILAAPGAGKVILVNKLVMNYTYANATAYANGGTVALQYGAGAYSAANAASGTIAATAITAANNTISTAQAASVNLNSAAAINTGLYLSNATAAFINGGAASNLSVQVFYSIVSGIV